MRDQINFFLRHPVCLVQKLYALRGHGHHTGGKPDDLAQDLPLLRAGALQHGVKGRDHRHLNVPQQPQQMTSAGATIDPVFMLHAQHIGTPKIDEIRGSLVCLHILFGQLKANLRWIRISVRPVAHRKHEAVRLRILAGNCSPQVIGERRNPATPWHIVS
jgi:hypothetical protein